MNEKNLIPINQRSESEQREMRRKGGINSGKTRKAQSTFRDILKDALGTSLNEKTNEYIDLLVKYGLKKKGAQISLKEAIGLMRLLRELQNPTPEGFDKLIKALGEDVTPDSTNIDKVQSFFDNLMSDL